jgi:hypothetical protein
MKYYQGKFNPSHPEKYMGDPTNIIYRSSWEFRFMRWCDNSSNVIKYSSEETIVPYRCPTDGKLHRYFVDFRIQIKNRNNELKTYLVEVKPSIQTMVPKYPGKKTKRYISESLTFMKNTAKWEAARNYCNDRNWEFVIITEKELGLD